MFPEIAVLAVVVIGLTLFFDFTNGFHDASSVVATVIACQALTPKKAIALAGTFTVVGALIGGSAVVYTIQEEMIYIGPGRDLMMVLLTGIIGATFWNILTWKFGIPSSSTHALVGGLVGSTVISAGPMKVGWGVSMLFSHGEISGMVKIVLALLISPPLGLGLAYVLQKVTTVMLRNARRDINRWLKRVQWATAALLAYSHGANDTQKHMGVIMLALISASMVSGDQVPIWVRLLAGVIMMVGTLGGGWTIMKTLGQKIYAVEPIHSLNSQVASTASVLAATIGGGPISTTHVVSSSVMGAGAGDRLRMVGWRVGRNMLLSWFITIPASAAVSALVFLLFGVIC